MKKYPDAIVVDAGDFLFKTDRLSKPHSTYTSTAPSQWEKQTASAGLLLDFYREMGYTLAGVGQKDLAAGPDFLRKQAVSNGIELISANITENGTMLFTPYKIVEKNGVKIGFTDVTSCSCVRYHRNEFECIPPEKALESVIPVLREKSDFVVLLSNAGDAVNRNIAKKFPDIDLIIKSGFGVKTYSPQMFGTVPAVMTHPKGKSVAVITLKRKEGTKGAARVQNTLILLTTRFPVDKEAVARVDSLERRFKRKKPHQASKVMHGAIPHQVKLPPKPPVHDMTGNMPQQQHKQKDPAGTGPH